jgi:DNA repair exonuclease SbcCD nuclease subunit
MTALVTADFHLSSNPRDDYRHKFIVEKLRETIVETRVKHLIILGDLTDQKDCHNAELVNDIVDYLHTFSLLCEVIILRGNHDCINPLKPFFEFAGLMNNITWITRPKVITIEGLGICTFLPHTRNHEKDWAELSFAPIKRDPNDFWIFCHNTFEGADAGTGHPLKGIPTTVFPKRAKVISGDIHVPQQLDQITYVGAPYTVTFGDSYDPRMLLIGRKGIEKSIRCFGVKKLTVDIVDPHNLPDYGLEINKSDLLKVRVHLKASDYAKWNEIQSAVRKWGEAYGAVVCAIQPIKISKHIKLARKRGATQTDRELMELYSKRRSVSDDVLKTGLWIMDKT